MSSESGKGFTLIEVLLASFILVLISLGVAAGLSAGIRAWESGERDLDYYQRKRIVYERVFREISGAINLRGQGEEDDRRRMIFDGRSDSLAFITTSESITNPGFPLGLKELSIAADPSEGLLFREAMFSGSEFFDTDRGVEYILDPFVTEIAFRYYYLPRPNRLMDEIPEEGEWLTEWGPDNVEIEETEEQGDDYESRLMTREITFRLPAAVEVTITSLNPQKDTVETWVPMVIPLKESRVMGVSVKRRQRN